MKAGDLVTHEDYPDMIGIVVNMDAGFRTVAVRWLKGGHRAGELLNHSRYLLIKLETSETL